MDDSQERLDHDREADQQEEEDRATQKRQILEGRGPGLWTEVRLGLQQKAKDLNDNGSKELLVAPATKLERLTIFAKFGDGQRETTAEFDSESYAIYYYSQRASDRIPDISENLRMAVNDDNSVVLLTSHGRPESADDVVDRILNSLMVW
ncbi:MAG TPA: hypothetical protein VIH91_01950 [Terriglobales bacterium]